MTTREFSTSSSTTSARAESTPENRLLAIADGAFRDPDQQSVSPLEGYDPALFARQRATCRAVRIRRWLHKNPELSGKEKNTAALIAHLLREWGYNALENVGGHGVVGFLERDPSMPTVGLRADIDALPIQETSNVRHASQVSDVMHACGHDGHAATLLAFAERAISSDSKCNLALIFQPAEETGTGARDMLADPALQDLHLDAIFGLHNKPEMAFGSVFAPDGALMASSDRFTLEISGLSSHPALPHQGSDVILSACAIADLVHQTFLRRRAASEQAIISITDFIAAGSDVTIPSQAELRGTIRCLNDQARTEAWKWIEEKTAKIAAVYDTRARAEIRRGCPATRNTPHCAEIVRRAVREIGGAAKLVTDLQASMGGDDFAYFAERWPSAYFWLGAGHQSPLLHTSNFDFNDDLIPLGVSTLEQIENLFTAASVRLSA